MLFFFCTMCPYVRQLIVCMIPNEITSIFATPSTRFGMASICESLVFAFNLHCVCQIIEQFVAVTMSLCFLCLFKWLRLMCEQTTQKRCALSSQPDIQYSPWERDLRLTHRNGNIMIVHFRSSTVCRFYGSVRDCHTSCHHHTTPMSSFDNGQPAKKARFIRFWLRASWPRRCERSSRQRRNRVKLIMKYRNNLADSDRRTAIRIESM